MVSCGLDTDGRACQPRVSLSAHGYSEILYEKDNVLTPDVWIVSTKVHIISAQAVGKIPCSSRERLHQRPKSVLVSIITGICFALLLTFNHKKDVIMKKSLLAASLLGSRAALAACNKS